MKAREGDRVEMKKAHPCGGKTWLVLRAGLDYRLRCETCGREVMTPRLKADKGIKKILPRENE